jgi:hypothetical protein
MTKEAIRRMQKRRWWAANGRAWRKNRKRKEAIARP